MEFKTISFQNADALQWNTLVGCISEASYLHRWEWLNYSSLFNGIVAHESFICLENERVPLAICPLAISKNPDTGNHEISFAGGPLGTPALGSLKPSLRRQLLKDIFARYQQIAEQHGAKRARFVRHPLTIAGASPFVQESFELQRFNLLSQVNNTIVIDLTLSLEMLNNNVSKYHRRHIKRSEKAGLTFKVFNGKSSADDLSASMSALQQAHFLSAGRATRPQATWEAMKEIARIGHGSLFVAYLGEVAISFLFCGEYEKMAFGWSQVNIAEYELNYSPRHFLEWQAIMYYKASGLTFYEIGERYFPAQFFHRPNAKELSIGEFKERYGGIMLPKIQWYGYFDPKEVMNELSPTLNNLGDYFGQGFLTSEKDDD